MKSLVVISLLAWALSHAYVMSAKEAAVPRLLLLLIFTAEGVALPFYVLGVAPWFAVSVLVAKAGVGMAMAGHTRQQWNRLHDDAEAGRKLMERTRLFREQMGWSGELPLVDERRASVWRR